MHQTNRNLEREIRDDQDLALIKQIRDLAQDSSDETKLIRCREAMHQTQRNASDAEKKMHQTQQASIVRRN